ncbi:MAG: aldehyde dehydrogenase [Deltaproteobacteria bacterium]|jgi:glyceraldehyde 3-phosphate dehydrogenase|nr:aldehyde dehydrogenase [Deltaproteobacteria bacterium]
MNVRMAINGFGRIGRAVYRICLKHKDLEIVAINDVNPDNQNIAYLLKYDSTYGRLRNAVSADEENLNVDEKKTRLFHKEDIAQVPWQDVGVDIVVDSSGIHRNLLSARKLKSRGIKHCIVTNSPKEEELDKTIIMGVNENSIEKETDFLISSSICDANAFCPVANVLDREFGIDHGFLTTLHPWLGYQNLLDGPSISYATPGKIHDYYALGRASTNSLIPKTTSAISASCKVLKQLTGKFLCLSFRVPTLIVGSADISVKLNKDAEVDTIKEIFEQEEKKQDLKIFRNHDEGLVSADFIASDCSSNIDHRWTMMNDANYLKMILWYDNEWGYSSRVVDLVRYLGSQWV